MISFLFLLEHNERSERLYVDVLTIHTPGASVINGLEC